MVTPDPSEPVKPVTLTPSDELADRDFLEESGRHAEARSLVPDYLRRALERASHEPILVALHALVLTWIESEWEAARLDPSQPVAHDAFMSILEALAQVASVASVRIAQAHLFAGHIDRSLVWLERKSLVRSGAGEPSSDWGIRARRHLLNQPLGLGKVHELRALMTRCGSYRVRLGPRGISLLRCRCP